MEILKWKVLIKMLDLIKDNGFKGLKIPNKLKRKLKLQKNVFT